MTKLTRTSPIRRPTHRLEAIVCPDRNPRITEHRISSFFQLHSLLLLVDIVYRYCSRISLSQYIVSQSSASMIFSMFLQTAWRDRHGPVNLRHSSLSHPKPLSKDTREDRRTNSIVSTKNSYHAWQPKRLEEKVLQYCFLWKLRSNFNSKTDEKGMFNI